MTSIGDVRELNSCTFNLSFTDENGNAFTPDTTTYRIDDESSGTNLVGPTSFTPGPTLDIDAAYNRIIEEKNQFEIRRVTVQWTSGIKRGGDEFFYRLMNLKYIGTTTTSTTTTIAPTTTTTT